MISKKEAKRWIRTVEISDPQTHPQHDFTVYKVKLKYIPVSTMDDEWQVLIYKRYNDFKKLYQTLSTYHKKLQQRDPFPDLVKASYFDRHDSMVIENRRASAEEVLNFCCQYYHLFTHEHFRLFFEGGLKRIVQMGISKSEEASATNNSALTLNPTSAELMTQESRNDFVELCTPLSPTPYVMNAQPQLSREDSTATSVSATLDETPSLPALPQDDDIACLSDLSSALKDLEKINPPPLICNSDDGSDIEEQSLDDNHLFKEDLFDNDTDKELCTKDSDLDVFDPYKVNKYDEFRKSNLEVLSFPQASKERSSTTDIPELTFSASPDEAYIQQASVLVARAQNCEVSQNWSEAFTAYKTAVGILLQGVQEDGNVARRTDVRAKTALYLEKAEYLHRTHIESDENKDNWTVIDNSVNLTLEASILNLCLPRSYLSQFKVLGFSGNLQLVYEKSSGESYALKCIRKCPFCNYDVKTIVVPHAPYMVRLHHIIETVDCVFLFLEYNTAVLLMDWIRDFTRRESNDYLDNSSTFHSLAGAKVYEGRSLLNNCIQTDSSGLPESKHCVKDSQDDVFKPSVPTISSSEEESSVTEDVHVESYAALFNTASVQSNRVAHNRQLSSDSWGSLKNEHMNITTDINLRIEEKDTNPILISQTVPIDNFSIASFGDEENESPSQLFQGGRTDSKFRYASSEQSNNRRPSLNRQVSSTSQSSKNRGKSLSDDIRSLDGDLPRMSGSDSTAAHSVVRSRSVDSSKAHVRLKDHVDTNRVSHCRRWSTVFDYFNDKRLSKTYQDTAPQIPESCLKQWAAELVVVIDTLHKKGLVLRDLHRENVLLGPGGHIRLTFFSQWSHAPPGSTYSSGCHLAGINLFVAPELSDCIYRNGPSSMACDWWSLGVLLYEMLTSCELSAVHPQGITSFTSLCFPQWLSKEAADLLNKLLVVCPGERLGSSRLDAEEVKMHPFFSGIDWLSIERNGY